MTRRASEAVGRVWEVAGRVREAAFFDISQTNRARELWLGSKEASGNSLSSRYGNLRSSVFGKPKGQVTFGNFPEGKRQPSAEDFAESPFGSVFIDYTQSLILMVPKDFRHKVVFEVDRCYQVGGSVNGCGSVYGAHRWQFHNNGQWHFYGGGGW